MSIFDRIFNRLATANSARVTTELRSRLLRIEALEDRRMLAAAPLGFTVVNTGGPGLRLTWIDNPAATGGYEIQSSVNGLDDEANPIVWKTGLWRTTKTVAAGQQSVDFDRYRSYYFRIQSLPAESTPLWSPIVFTSAPPEDKVVKVSAAVLTGPDAIKLQWPEELKFATSEYTISRKAKDALVWDELVTDHSDNFYEDKVTAPVDPIQVGKAYEYRVERCSTAGCQFSPSGTGYVYAGIDFALSDDDSTIESPGTVILIVDDTQAAALAGELDRLESDLIAEGWNVDRFLDVAPHDDNDFVSVANRDAAIVIRQDIIDAYEVEGANVTSVFLIGHVPIPMSGHNCPDGHGERPMPADVFYGEMDGVVDIDDDPGGDWTDATQVPNEFCPGSSADVDNNPNDGAFDQKDVPTDGDGKPVELMVGRVDMRGLPNFQQYNPGLTEAELETELLRRYLDKDHAFRSGQVAVERGALIRDQFAFTDSSTGAWQTISGLFGPAANPSPEVPDNIDVADWPEPIWPLAVGLRSIDSADLDNDGDADFLTASYDDNRIAWYENVGGDLTAQHIISDEVLGASAVIAADLNNDGCDDIVAASSETGEILWYDNDIDIPTGTCQKTFAQQPLIEDPLRGMSSVFAIDLDGDGGDIDVNTWTDLGADGASSVGAAGGGGIIPRKYLTRASDSDIVQVTRRVTLLAIAI